MPRNQDVAWFALSINGRVRGAEGSRKMGTVPISRKWGLSPFLPGHHGQHEVFWTRHDAVLAALPGLQDPHESGLGRVDVESQTAALVDDVAADVRRAVEVHQHETLARIGV